MIPDLTDLERRVAAFVKHGDPQPVLAPEAVAEARSVWQGDNSPVEVVHTVALLHWCRYLAAAADDDLEISGRLFGLLLSTRPELVPDEVYRILARSADRSAEQAAALLGAVDRTYDADALTQVIELLRWSITCTPTDHPDIAGRLSNLSVALRIRFDRDGRPADLDQAVEVGLAAVAVGAADHRDRGRHLYNAGGHLHLRFLRGGALIDLDQAIGLFEQAITGTRPGQDAHFMMVDHLGRALTARCTAAGPLAEVSAAIRLWLDRGGILMDLERAILLLRHLVSITPSAANELADLGYALVLRSSWTGADRDLDEAIGLLRRAEAGTPPDDPDYGGRLARLAGALRLRFEHTDALEYLEEAASMLRAALIVLPADHPDRVFSQAYLGICLHSRFSRTGALQDLDEAITHLRDTARGHDADPEHLSALGAALHTRFDRTGDPEDQIQSIEVLRRAVTGFPTGHPRRAAVEANLAATLLGRWQQSGTQADVDQAIDLLERAEAGLPKDAPIRQQVMSNLGVALRLRFERTGVATDLDKAITAGTEFPSADPARLVNVAVALVLRFGRDGTPRDLDLGIAMLTDAVASTPENHPELCSRQSMLGSAMRERYKRDGQPEDLRRAIELLEPAVVATPSDHPDRARVLSNLAGALADRSESDGVHGYREQAVALWREATRLSSAPSMSRLTAAEAWAEVLVSVEQWGRALEGYAVAVDLLATSVWNAADQPGREQQIAYWAYLGGDAAACAAAADRPGQAIEMFEQGRALLWSQVSGRDDMTALRAVAMPLVERLVALRSQLDLNVRFSDKD
ncbi:tetratricopeptide repeat protein [Micromonospora echinospora]|uniref:tetratricopeptide repeat protein n=1 Tax=Micromonospora echinospora TaxID=1877 RepID=UPI003443042E